MSEKKLRIKIEPFQWQPGDPLEAEYKLAAQLIPEALKSNGMYSFELNLDTTDAGKKILEASPEAAVRIVVALVAHAKHFDDLARQARALATNEMERLNWHHSCPEWEHIWPPRQISALAVHRIMRRNLPFQSEHLVALADWITASDWKADPFCPLKSFVKAIENHGPIEPGETALRTSLGRVAKALGQEHSKEAPKLARRIEEILGVSFGEDATIAEDELSTKGSEPDASQPAELGSKGVLVALKQFLRTMPDIEATPSEIVGFDRFPMPVDSPLRQEHEMINMLLPEFVGSPGYHDPHLAKTVTGRTILALEPKEKGRFLLAVAERCATSYAASGGGLENPQLWQSRYFLNALLNRLPDGNLKLNRADLFDLLLFFSALSDYQWISNQQVVQNLLQQAESLAPFTPGERHVLHRLRCRTVRAAPFGHPAEDIIRFNNLLRDGAFFALVPGEAWSDAVNRELPTMRSDSRERWLELLRHAATASGSRPSVKWMKTAKEILGKLGTKVFTEALLRWFPLVNSPRTVRRMDGGLGIRSDSDGIIDEDNATCLRGFLWLAPQVVSPEIIRAIGALTVSCYRKVPGVGPRAVKVGNAGVYALSQVNEPFAVGQLALLKAKVKFGSAQKEIEKAFTLAAERSGLPREELEEMAVPTYGLTGVGVRQEKMGDFTASLAVVGTDATELVWIKPDGKIQRSTPAEVKASYAEDLKELQAAAKDIAKMLPAQKERIDSLFLQQRTWQMDVWRERYLNHPLVGTLARRLLWEFWDGSSSMAGIWFNGQLVDIDLKTIAAGSTTNVRLWHPIGKNTDEITGWRAWLEAQQIQQPFKQAHREIYLLTEAEQQTRVYSNRYAAHVLKQHQFNALCALRGWKNQLRLAVDAEYRPPSLRLSQWGLRAEFWVEGIGHNFGTDTNESGVYHRLSTDQVRFYRLDAEQRSAHAGGGGYHPGHQAQDEPVPLNEIPALVLSEVMRDVDMFVGVASVGNDQAWSDGGPEGRYREYWQNYSFGELNASAKTRRDVLGRLVPKLKIAGQCSFEDKFLVVNGALRSYKIHLGSGNILMKPNDQYLCIVPKQSDALDSPVLLPFEGDRTLSIILSKAFLLADESKIKDPSILGQIKR